MLLMAGSGKSEARARGAADGDRMGAAVPEDPAHRARLALRSGSAITTDPPVRGLARTLRSAHQSMLPNAAGARIP